MITFTSYHGDDPLKHMRQIKNLDKLSDSQCLQLFDEMQKRDWKLTGAVAAIDPKFHDAEVAFQKARWLINRARAMVEA